MFPQKKLAQQKQSQIVKIGNHSRARTALRWIGRVVGGIVLLVALLVAVGAGWQWWATQADQRAYSPPGDLIDVGGYRLHLVCMGEGSPTVILDALGDGTSAHWGWVQPAVAKTTRVCAYDRAGRGWSDIAPTPRDGHTYAQDLHTLLTQAAVENPALAGPKVLVGHSFGAMVARIYADFYPDEVVGMVLVDPGLPALRTERMPAEALAQVAADEGLMNAAPWMARLGIFRLLGSGSTQPEPQRSHVQAFYASNKQWDGLLADLHSLALTDAQVEATGTLQDRPLLLIAATRGWADPNADTDEARRVYNTLVQELLPLSTNSAYRQVEGASHASLVLEEAHAAHVSAGIVEVVEAIRADTPLSPE